MPTNGVLNRGTQFAVDVNAAGANVGFVSTDVSLLVRIPQINNLLGSRQLQKEGSSMKTFAWGVTNKEGGQR